MLKFSWALCSPLFCGFLAASFAQGVADAQAATPSGSALLAESAAAYDALTSYGCHTNVLASGMGNSNYTCTADIKFARPGQLCASGTTMTGSPFSMVANGTSTDLTLNGSTGPQQSAELGIASLTGIAQGAATLIPALLLRTKWGYPFYPGQIISNEVITQSVNGQPCYEVLVLSPLKEAYWIDKKTFLIDQAASKITIPGIGTLHQLQTITNSVANPSFPTGTFTVPGN